MSEDKKIKPQAGCFKCKTLPCKCKPMEYWLHYNGMTGHRYSWDDKKPSGISGGGSTISIHTVDKAAYNKAIEALKKILKPGFKSELTTLEVYSQAQITAWEILKELGELE